MLLTTAMTCIVIAIIILLGTYVAVWFATIRPHKLVREDNREVRLMSVGGNILHTWSTEPPGDISFAHPKLVEKPDASDGRRLALLGFHKAWDQPYPNSLVAYDVDQNLIEPFWARQIEPGDTLPDPHGRGYRPTQFGVTLGAVFDIFAETPEPEIVAIHNVFPFSQSIIRIYDLSGEVQYEVWHDGILGGCEWMSHPRLLVFSGSNDVRTWEELGYPGFGMDRPMVVFAIRPKRGVIRHAFLDTKPGDAALNPVWYNCMFPPAGAVQVRPPWKGDPGQSVGVGTVVDNDLNAGWFWDLDEDGCEVPESRETNDEYKRHKSELPDPDIFKLRPFAPIAERGLQSATPETEPSQGPTESFREE